MNFHRAFGESGGALDGLDLVGIRADERLVGKIDAAEFEAVIFWSGLECQ